MTDELTLLTINPEVAARELSPSMVDALTSELTDDGLIAWSQTTSRTPTRTLNALIRRGLLERSFYDGDWVGCELTPSGYQARAYLLNQRAEGEPQKLSTRAAILRMIDKDLDENGQAFYDDSHYAHTLTVKVRELMTEYDRLKAVEYAAALLLDACDAREEAGMTTGANKVREFLRDVRRNQP